MTTKFRLSAALAVLCLAAAPSYAGIIFTFTESGGDVIMTSSGVIDTSLLVLQGSSFGWGGTGIEENGNHDIMGGTAFGGIDTSFGFNTGTDFSPWATANGPWANDVFTWTVDSGSKSFTTYISGGVQVPGLGIRGVDLVGSFWSPDQTWSISGQTFASLQMFTGTYTVTDALTGEFITFQVGDASPVPEPSTLLLLGAGFVALGLRFRQPRKQ